MLLRKKNSEINYDFILKDPRFEMFKNAMIYINYEMIEGDILEFGVWAGKTLAQLGFLYKTVQAMYKNRTIYGFDSFRGLINIKEKHPRWYEGICNINLEGGHPVCKHNDPVSPSIVLKLFEYYKLEKPIIIEGFFEETIKNNIDSISNIALVHLDCDLYESTIQVLEGIHSKLSDGALLLFDDYYHYRANPRKGQAKALNEFISNHKDKWEIIPFKAYHNVCKSFFAIKI